MITNTPVLALATWSIVLIVILVVLVAALIGLYFFGIFCDLIRYLVPK